MLAIFKKFHRTRLTLYQGDEPNLAKARAKINEEFKNNKIVQNEEQIPELITIAKEVELFYRTRVVQAVQTDEGKMSKFSSFSFHLNFHFFFSYLNNNHKHCYRATYHT